MITNYRDYEYYLEMDKKALGITKKKPGILGDEIWKYERELRKGEYLINCRPLFYKFRFMFHKFKFHYLSILCCGYSIPYNCVEEGLACVHMGPIIINSAVRVGHNCRIHSGVTIGATNGLMEAAQIGNNVYIGSGAKIIGNIKIGDNVVIAAGAVVVRNVEDNVTVGGVPARVISEKCSSIHHSNLPNY